MKERRYIAPILLTLAFVAVAGYLFVDFAAGGPGIPQATLKSKESAGAIVVLTGGKGRIEEGVRLLEKGAAPTLILAGVDADADMGSIFLGNMDPALGKRIILEKRSASTYENAVEVKGILEQTGVKSIIFITSSYHVRRALFIFTHVLDKGISVRPRLVSSPNFDESRWWASKNIVIIAPEFLKYQWYRLRFAVEG